MTMRFGRILVVVAGCTGAPNDKECPERQSLVGGHLPVRATGETGAPDSAANSSPPDTSGETGQTPGGATIKTSKYTCTCTVDTPSCEVDLSAEVELGGGPVQITAWAHCNPDFDGDAYYNLCENGEAWDLIPAELVGAYGPARDGMLKMTCDGGDADGGGVAVSTAEIVVYVTTFPSP